MSLKTNKTWSQQELAIKLRLHQDPAAELLSPGRQHLFILAAKTTLAATLC